MADAEVGMVFDRMMMKRVPGLVLGALTIVGCGGLANQLKVQAATDLHCTPDGITFEEGQGDPLVGTVKGCGKTAVYGFDVTAYKWVSPIERAAFETSCPKDQLTTAQLGASQVGVKGCGHTLVFVHSREKGWILNSSSDTK